MPKAEQILDIRNAFADGTLLVIRVWLLQASVLPSRHRFKYSFFYGRPGEILILFDNERGKGDHMHLGPEEYPYDFTDIETLTADFLRAVRSLRQKDDP